MTAVRDQLFFPQNPPGSRFRFSRIGVQPSPGSSTIELPSAFAESGAYPPDRELPSSPRQCSLPLACRHPPEGHQIGARKRRTPENTILSQPYCRRVSTDRPNRESSQLAASLEGEPYSRRKDPPTVVLRNPGFGGRGHEMYYAPFIIISLPLFPLLISNTSSSMESMLDVFLSDGVFRPCDHGLGFIINYISIHQTINQ